MLSKAPSKAAVWALAAMPSFLGACSNSEGGAQPFQEENTNPVSTPVENIEPAAAALPEALSHPVDQPSFFEERFSGISSGIGGFYSDAKVKGSEWGGVAKEWSVATSSDAAALASKFGSATSEWCAAQAAGSAEVAKEWSTQAEAWGKEIAAKAEKEWVPATKDGINRSVQTAEELGKQAGPAALAAAETGAEGIKTTIVSGSEVLSKWGVGLETQRKMIRVGVDIVPVLGAVKKYDDARMMWEEGKVNGDLELQHSAKELCVVAMGELGVDVGLLGGGELLTGAQGLIGNLEILKAASSASKLDVEALPKIAGKLLLIDRVDSIVTEALESDVPDKLFEVIFPSIKENVLPPELQRVEGEKR